MSNTASISARSTVGLNKRFAGVLLGTAVGDALGLPAENLSAERIRRNWPGPLTMRFIFGRGMISDDTEHTIMVAQALLSHPRDSAAFQRAFGWKLRWWFAALPAGVGLATARACLKLWIGFPKHKCSVKSGGSGPAMRSAIIGAFFADEPEKRREFVLASSRLTHSGWQAETAALAVAEAAALSAQCEGVPTATQILPVLRALSEQEEWQMRMSQIESSLESEDSVSEFVGKMGLKRGISGYALHVVPIALYAWLRHPHDFRTALATAISCGGDTDTVGAILGGLIGAGLGSDGIPVDWRNALVEWPRTNKFFLQLAQHLTDEKRGQPKGPVNYLWPGLILRNIFFLVIVLFHGFRRLFQCI
jgi:ADP-ribosylglycohydrolase